MDPRGFSDYADEVKDPLVGEGATLGIVIQIPPCRLKSGLTVRGAILKDDLRRLAHGLPKLGEILPTVDGPSGYVTSACNVINLMTRKHQRNGVQLVYAQGDILGRVQTSTSSPTALMCSAAAVWCLVVVSSGDKSPRNPEASSTLPKGSHPVIDLLPSGTPSTRARRRRNSE